MTKVIVDEPLRSKLDGSAGLVEICDASGRILGFFRPLLDKSQYDNLECPVSDEELRKRVAEEGGRPLKEILADLEQGA